MYLQTILNGENCWPELKEKGFIEGDWTGIARLPKGTASGKSTVTIRIELPDGQTVLAQTSLLLLVNAVRAFEIREEIESNPTH